MTAVGTQPVGEDLLAGLHRRLESVAIAVVRLDADGGVELEGTARSGSDERRRSLERLIVGSPFFAKVFRQNWGALCGADPGGKSVAIWPGLWLVPMPKRPRHAPGASGGPEAVRCAVLLTPTLLTSEQFQLICHTRQLDPITTARQIDPDSLISEREVERLTAMIGWLQNDSIEIDHRYRELQTLSRQLGESYEELSLLYMFTTTLQVNQPRAKVLTEACAQLCKVVGLKWMALQLVAEEPRLYELAGQVFAAGSVGCEQDGLREVGDQLMRRLPVPAAPMVVNDTAALNIDPLTRIGADLLLVPLLRDGELIALLFGCDKVDGSRISSTDTKMCDSLAGSVSIFLENTMYFEDMQEMFIGTLHALTKSIDAKDSYTHGHSERVALLSRMLADAAGLDEQVVEKVYLTGLVHDVGKIGVPESVLCKPGLLAQEEFELIKQHPEIGVRIIADIRQMRDLIPGVLYHHERWDGNGYPHGLGGQEIPVFGRLICLADSFDAMCSERTYRRSMNAGEACEEILRCAGTQFDPDLAGAFVEMDFKPFFDLVLVHHRQDRPVVRSREYEVDV